MTNESSVVTFNIRQPYQSALRAVRRALSEHGLQTPVELDVTSRIRKDLGAGVAPCTVLFVDDPALLLEGIVFNRGGALGIPQPVVISGNQRDSEVLVRGAESLVIGGLPRSVQNPLLQLHLRIIRAMEAVAERNEVPALVE